MATSDPNIEAAFPQLASEGYKITSPEDQRYNCIAWAREINNKFMWPDANFLYFWPSDVPREVSLSAFIKLYENVGYAKCATSDASYEAGYLKIAIYVDSQGAPLHAARQLPNGKWTSKLGPNKDIEHNTLKSLEGKNYGSVAVILKRAL